MDIKIKVELYKEKIKVLQGAIEPSLQQAASATKTQIALDQVVPKNIGELERSAFIRKKSRSKYQIVYDTPYARRLYWHPEYNFRTDKNPNAQGLWLHAFIDGNKKLFFRNAFVQFYRTNTKGLIT